MSKTSQSDGEGGAWSVVVRSQERVLAGLECGECDGILPDEWLVLRSEGASPLRRVALEPDQLIQTALDEGLLDLFDDFPDPRRRRSIDKRLFCRVLLCARLIDARSMAQAGRVIFHSAILLDKLSCFVAKGLRHFAE